jgi:acyl-CoA synthetase (AMP-forming)/AMP-acid ligase II
MAFYKCPRLVEFIDELPKSGSSKILWCELQEREQEKMAKTKLARRSVCSGGGSPFPSPREV